MKLTTLTPAEASSLSTETLGLDASVFDLTGQEGLAASLRRAASFMCPTSPRLLVDATFQALSPLAHEGGLARDDLVIALDLLLSTGDLIELSQAKASPTRLVYLGPPSYVELRPGSYLLVGVRPFGTPLLDAALEVAVEYRGTERIATLDAKDVREVLEDAGLRFIERDHWVTMPAEENAASLVARFTERLDAASSSGEVDGLQLLDPATSTRFYAGRWRPPQSSDTGVFVARRPQAYGANLWCAVRLSNGAPTKILELPVDNPLLPARDEAWRMQMAIDSTLGRPQQYGSESAGTDNSTVVKFYSPIPSFAERYLRLIGTALRGWPRTLFAFEIPNDALPELERVLHAMLWMRPTEGVQ